MLLCSCMHVPKSGPRARLWADLVPVPTKGSYFSDGGTSFLTVRNDGTVDATKHVAESNEDSNKASGRCLG